jgi:hypothetical protein
MSSEETGLREKNISQKKIGIVSSASFDTLIAAITDKSEKAQCTFLYRLFSESPGEVLAMAQKYSADEIKRRAKTGTNS